MPMRKKTRKALRVRQMEARSNGNRLVPSANPDVQRLRPLSPREVATILGVSEQSLATWRWKGKYPELRPFKRFGRVRYPVVAVEAFVNGEK